MAAYATDLKIMELEKEVDAQKDKLEAMTMQLQVLKKRINKLAEQTDLMQIEINAIEEIVDPK